MGYEAAVVNSHALVSTNRMWAIFAPISYRRNHSIRVAILMYATLCVYVHIMALPVVLLDAIYYRAPQNCYVNSNVQRILTMVVSSVGMDLPIIFILMSYPFLWYKRKQLRKTTSSRNKVYRHYTGNHSHAARIPRIVTRNQKADRLLVLTFLTASIFVCWTPGEMQYKLDLSKLVQVPLVVTEATLTLHSLQAVIDPILFILNLEDLKRTCYRMLSRF